MYRRDEYTCQNCGARGGPYGDTELHAHHIVPIAQGGSHKPSNLTTLCKQCHDAAHGRKTAPTAIRTLTRKSTGTGELTFVQLILLGWFPGIILVGWYLGLPVGIVSILVSLYLGVTPGSFVVADFILQLSGWQFLLTFVPITIIWMLFNWRIGMFDNIYEQLPYLAAGFFPFPALLVRFSTSNPIFPLLVWIGGLAVCWKISKNHHDEVGG